MYFFFLNTYTSYIELRIEVEMEEVTLVAYVIAVLTRQSK